MSCTQVQTGILTAAMNGDIETLQRLGDVAPAVVPFVCNEVSACTFFFSCTPTSILLLSGNCTCDISTRFTNS